MVSTPVETMETMDRTALKSKEEELLSMLAENRRQQQISEAREAQRVHDMLVAEVKNKDNAKQAAKAVVAQAQERLKNAESSLETASCSHREACAKLAQHESKLTAMPERHVYINDEGKCEVVFGTQEFLDLVERLRQEQIKRTPSRNLAYTGSSKDQLRNACDRHSAVAAATRGAIKLLESNNLPVPDSYRSDLLPGIDCYS